MSFIELSVLGCDIRAQCMYEEAESLLNKYLLFLQTASQTRSRQLFISLRQKHPGTVNPLSPADFCTFCTMDYSTSVMN
jgi:hypothetical protein